MLLIAIVLFILRLIKFKTEGQTIYKNPHCKVAKLKLKFRLPWASLMEL